VSGAAIIGVDWGSSSMRAMRIAADGRILDVRRADDGVFTDSGDFETRLRAHLGTWLSNGPALPLILCGMIGSDRGWCPAGYVAAPAGLADLANALTSAAFDGVARIVPGVRYSCGDEAEVMRGEETLVMGFLAQTGLADARLCLPGTHSKWLRVRRGQIEGFRTYMTGELRALLLQSGALATGVAQEASPDAFVQGMRTSASALGRSLFQARARRLLGALRAEWTASFVSGVLIGNEVAAESGKEDSGVPLFILARDALARDYALALSGLPHTIVDPEPLAALGLLRIARQAGLA
jgi:2-dehydro-3-deoxygalactonokinase